MTYLPDEVLFDLRLVERHIRAGLITQAQVDERLSSMEDMGEQADVIDLDQMQADATKARFVDAEGAEIPE